MRVRASDNLWSTWASASVVVENAVPPGTVANITCPSSVYAGDPFECTAGVYGATPVRYRFTWGDGSPEVVVPSSASSVTASYTYVAGTRGTRTARVYVDLPGGKYIPATAQINVQAPPVPTVTCAATPKTAKAGSGVKLFVNYDGRGSYVRTVSYTVNNPGGGSQQGSWTVNEWVGTKSTTNISDTEGGTYPVTVVAANGETSGTGICDFVRGTLEPPVINCSLAQSVFMGSGSGTYYCTAVAESKNSGATVQMSVRFVGPDGSVAEDSSCKGNTGQNIVTCTNKLPDSRIGEWKLLAHASVSAEILSEEATKEYAYQVVGVPPVPVITHQLASSINPNYPTYVGVVNGQTRFHSNESYAQGGATIVSRTWRWLPGKPNTSGCGPYGGVCESSSSTITPYFDDRCTPSDGSYPYQPVGWASGYVSLTVEDSRGASATATMWVEYQSC